MADASTGKWPHDPDEDEKGSEGMRKYDMAILTKMVGKDKFPITKSEFVDEFGDWPVRINYHTVMSVAEIFEYVEPESFETKDDFHRAVGNAFRKNDLWEFHPSE